MLGELAEQGAETVSSEELAVATGVNSAKLRKDLSYIGSYGIRGVGYEVAPLLHQLERALGLNHRQSVALVGIGNLGHALAGYGGFGNRGFPVTALFDVDPDLVGIHINGILVEPVRSIPTICRERDVTIGMIATPGPAAQGVCDLLVRGRGAVHPQLRAGGAAGARRGRGAQGGPGRRAADPGLPRGPPAPGRGRGRRARRTRQRARGARAGGCGS